MPVADPLGERVGYAYDASGNRTGLSCPDGRAAEHAYDVLDRLSSVAFAGGTTQYSYDAVGNAAAAFANGVTLAAAYDALDRPTALAYADARGRAAASFSYGYDAVGNVVSETADGARDLKDDRASAYDALRRLISVTDREKKPIVFRYDANGNLTERVRDDDVVTFGYDAADRLRTLSDEEESLLFGYDGDGMLVREQRLEADEPGEGRALQYTLDVAGSLAQVLTTSDGKDTAGYLYGLSRIAAVGAKETRFFAADVRGSPRLLTDERGRVAGVRSFDAWGVPDPDRSVSKEEGPAALSELFGFTGERQDAVSGLLYLRARWYDPASGASSRAIRCSARGATRARSTRTPTRSTTRRASSTVPAGRLPPCSTAPLATPTTPPRSTATRRLDPLRLANRLDSAPRMPSRKYSPTSSHRTSERRPRPS